MNVIADDDDKRRPSVKIKIKILITFHINAPRSTEKAQKRELTKAHIGKEIFMMVMMRLFLAVTGGGEKICERRAKKRQKEFT